MACGIAYKIAEAADWTAMLETGRYGGSALDRADGFIHLSTPGQLDATAAKHFAGKDDLVLVTVDLTEVMDILKWEPSRGGDLFPHLYGDLPREAVLAQEPVRVDDAGFIVPEGGAA